MCMYYHLLFNHVWKQQLVVSILILTKISMSIFPLLLPVSRAVVKLLDSEHPYQVYLQIKDDLKTSKTSFYLRKWLFSSVFESELEEDERVCELLYQQAVEDMSSGLFDAGADDSDLRMLKAQGNKKKVVNIK